MLSTARSRTETDTHIDALMREIRLTLSLLDHAEKTHRPVVLKTHIGATFGDGRYGKLRHWELDALGGFRLPEAQRPDIMEGTRYVSVYWLRADGAIVTNDRYHGGFLTRSREVPLHLLTPEQIDALNDAVIRLRRGLSR